MHALLKYFGFFDKGSNFTTSKIQRRIILQVNRCFTPYGLTKIIPFYTYFKSMYTKTSWVFSKVASFFGIKLFNKMAPLLAIAKKHKVCIDYWNWRGWERSVMFQSLKYMVPKTLGKVSIGFGIERNFLDFPNLQDFNQITRAEWKLKCFHNENIYSARWLFDFETSLVEKDKIDWLKVLEVGKGNRVDFSYTSSDDLMGQLYSVYCNIPAADAPISFFDIKNTSAFSQYPFHDSAYHVNKLVLENPNLVDLSTFILENFN
jgi:hypothetical protein